MRNVKRNKTWQHSGSRMVYGKTRTRQYQKRTLQMAYYSLALFALLIVQTPSFAHNTHAQDSLAQDTVIFHFSPGEKLFRKNYKKNKTAIELLGLSIRKHRQEIENGDIKVRVLSFCDSFGSPDINLQKTRNQSNQVKNYFIIHGRMKEPHFQTTNTPNRWHNVADLVTVSYLFRVKQNEVVALSIPPKEELIAKKESTDTIIPEPTSQVEVKDVPQPDSTTLLVPKPAKVASLERHPCYQWAIKTNVVYLAATVANIGTEMAFNKHYSMDLSFIYSPYAVARNYSLRFLAIQPEFRYWPNSPMKGHFFGIHLNIGAFNISVDRENRYQSPDGFYGAGISYGYALPFTRRWAAEFTIGAGYIHTKYDTFYNIPNGARYKKDTPYNYWGLTKAGINMVYKFGK